MKGSLVLALCCPVALSAQGAITGIVLRDSIGTPISDAIVEIASLKRGAVTDAAGRFRIDDLKVGFFELTVKRIGFKPYTERLTIRDGKTVTLEIPMMRMVVLDSIKVVDARIRSFDEHRALGVGQFLTRAELAQKEHIKLGNVVAQLVGARVRFDIGGTAFLAGRGTNHQNKNSICYSQVYLDNMLVYRNEMIPGGRLEETPFNLNSIFVDQVEALEYYASAGQAPHKYNIRGSECGVLVLHTRRQKR